MSAVPASSPARPAVLLGELAKLPAFLRRDFLVAWSYRMSFVTDVAGLFLGAFMFYFVGLMVDESVLPTYGGTRASYMEFVAVGIALGLFIALGLGRIAGAINGEQLMGTLESLLMTPTAAATIQLGSVLYDLIYIPVRTAIFLVLIAFAFGLDFEASGLAPAAVTLLLFVPFIWGLGVASAGATLTFRRGGTAIGLGVTLLTIGSGAYFPLDLLPGWVSTLAEVNPMALAIDGMRESLIGGASWSEIGPDLLVLGPTSLVSLVVGYFVFRLAQWRERRRGTLGLY
jgi:ABC-2 type transport system permease protein